VACADVATAKAKATAINLIIVFSYVILSRRKFLEGCRDPALLQPSYPLTQKGPR
jgi:hypothetical protein